MKSHTIYAVSISWAALNLLVPALGLIDTFSKPLIRREELLTFPVSSKTGLYKTGTTVNGTRGLPKNLSHMRSIWRSKMKLEMSKYDSPQSKAAFRTDLKVVFGILSMATDIETRQIIRDTWFKHPTVCKAAGGPVDRCPVYVAFAVAHLAKDIYIDVWDRGFDDMVYVTKDSPMLTKTRLWFEAAVREFPWATHYGKMDTDTFPFFYALIPSIPAPSTTCETYFGSMLDTHACKGIRGVRRGGTTRVRSKLGVTNFPDVEEYDDPGTQTILFSDGAAHARRRWIAPMYVCMHGSLYVISATLAKGMVSDAVFATAFNGRHTDHEDVSFGMAVSNYIRETDTCLKITNAVLRYGQRLWYHVGQYRGEQGLSDPLVR